MHSVVLTELGISVFSNGGQLEKTFPFKDAVDEYLAIKKKKSKLDKLVKYLNTIPAGVKISDASLLKLLKKTAIDAQMMGDEELENIQYTKQQIIVDSGFAQNAHDALEKLRAFSLGLSSSKVTEISESPDLHIIQAINTLDELDKLANALSSRLKEWYGLHFPELDNITDSIYGYARIALEGRRDKLTKKILSGAGFQDTKIEMILLIATKSKGGNISDMNLSMIQSVASQVISLYESRKMMEEYVDSQMKENAPNLSAILGTTVGARMLGRAGSLQRLASMPASTIQVLGAEKALFRAIKTGSQPPKHGLLFQHSLVHAAPRWQRGKIARAIAAKAGIAARVDVYGEGLNEMLLDKLNTRVGEIGKKYANPVIKDPKQESQIQSNRKTKRYSKGRRSDGKKSSKSKKKRKRIGK